MKLLLDKAISMLFFVVFNIKSRIINCHCTCLLNGPNPYFTILLYTFPRLFILQYAKNIPMLSDEKTSRKTIVPIRINSKVADGAIRLRQRVLSLLNTTLINIKDFYVFDSVKLGNLMLLKQSID